MTIYKSSIEFTQRAHFWITNAEFAKTNKKFRKACKRIIIGKTLSEDKKIMIPIIYPPTSRQASKWRSKKGRVWKETHLLENQP